MVLLGLCPGYSYYLSGFNWSAVCCMLCPGRILAMAKLGRKVTSIFSYYKKSNSNKNVVSQFYFGLLRNLIIKVCLPAHLSMCPRFNF